MDADNNYIFRDMFVSRIKGRTPQGRLIADLAPVGETPSFAAELSEYGLENMIHHTADMWN